MNHNSCSERLYNAVESLVIGNTLKVRVDKAMFAILPLRPDGFPEPNQNDFEEIKKLYDKDNHTDDEYEDISKRIALLAIQVIKTENHIDNINRSQKGT
jgi:hypothetical protein